jgi:hypothetical protein
MNKEIIWNIVNSILAAALVFLGAISDGGISKNSIIAAVVVAASVAIIQFKNYWQKEEQEYCNPKLNKTIGSFISF